LLCFLAIYVLVRAIAQRSEAYSAAIAFARADPRIASEIGPVTDVKLGFLNRFEVSTSGDSGAAHFDLDLLGDNARATLDVHLFEVNRVWTVNFARLDRGHGTPAVAIMDAAAPK